MQPDSAPASVPLGRKFVRSLSTPRIAVAGLFAFTVAFMLLLAGDGMEILYLVRSYVAVKASWSSAQASSVYFLNRYAQSRNEADFDRYNDSLRIINALLEARMAMEKATPDALVAQAALLRAGAAPGDVEGMVRMYQRFRQVSFLRDAIQIWHEVDQVIAQIEPKALELHKAVKAGEPKEHLDLLLNDIDALQAQLPRLEKLYAERLGEGAHWAKDIVKYIIAISAILLLTLGILVTWRLLAEATEAKEKYRNLINTANDAILVISRATGKILEANLKAEELTGLSSPDLVGRNFKDLLASGENWSEQDTDNQELLLRHQDGHEIPVEASVNLTKVDGKVVVQSILRDLSERRRLESQLRQAAKMDAVGRLAGGVAHDFNNLLTVISGYGDLIQTQLAENDPLQESVDEILKAADRASSLTQQLLAFSRHHMMKPEVLDLNEVVGGVEMMLRRLIGANIEFEIQKQDDLGCIRADARQIEQVIVNLVVNARDAMEDGGRLIIRTRNLKVTERDVVGHAFLLPGTYVSVAVSDTGHGMDEKTKACIFEPFFTTKESGKGTGLGLAMVYGTVKQSGGYVMVHSTPGQGTEFEILLPRVEGQPTVPVKQAIATGGGTETLLLVEDQEELRRLLSTVLRRNGYTVLDATDGSAALEAFDQDRERISLVITDVVMPILGGADLGAMLLEKSPDLKLLYMSGYTDSLAPRQGGLPAGAAFLQKPFTPEVLARKVRDILDNRGQTNGHV